MRFADSAHIECPSIYLNHISTFGNSIDSPTGLGNTLAFSRPGILVTSDFEQGDLLPYATNTGFLISGPHGFAAIYM